MYTLPKEAGIDLKGIFLNADAGFDADSLHEMCAEKQIEVKIAGNTRKEKPPKEDYGYFDEELYRQRNFTKRTNAWLDGFKTLFGLL